MIRRPALAAVAALLTVAAVLPAVATAAAPAHIPQARRSAVTAAARLTAFGRRGSGASRKLDGPLADLVRHAGRVRAGHELADLKDLSPAARFRQAGPADAPRVLVDVVTQGDPQALKAALVALGLTDAAVFANDVGGWLPVKVLAAAAGRAEVRSMRAAMPHTRAGAVTSQGDFAQRSDLVRAGGGPDGTGVTVGVLSDSFNCYQTYAASGVPASGLTGYAYNGFLADAPADAGTNDLPGSVRVLKDVDCMSYTQYQPASLPFTDEGRAMLQVVHDVAPGAQLAFYTADNSEADFANGILALAQAGARVIADDVGYFDEPFFQDGLIAQAINAVAAPPPAGQGVAYFSAAGNDGDNSYESTQPSFPVTATSGANQGEALLNFDPSGATTTTSLPITLPGLYPGEYLALVVEWDQPYVTGAAGSPGAASQIDLCVTGAGQDGVYDLDGNPDTCTGPNDLHTDPVQVLIIGNPASATTDTPAQSLRVSIGLAGGPAPGRLKFVLEDNGAGGSINSFNTHSPTLQGHPSATGAAAVGAAYYFTTPRCGTATPQPESFSSLGGSPILFDTTGTRLSTPVLRQKPDFVGPDGVNNTFLGYQLTRSGSPSQPPSTSPQGCQDATASATAGVYPSFFGTSAAAPHVAGIAALMLQSRSNATADEIHQALRSTALPMTGTTPDAGTGYGFIQADAALTALTSGGSGASSSSSLATGNSPSGPGGGGGGTDLLTLCALGMILAWQLGLRVQRKRAATGQT